MGSHTYSDWGTEQAAVFPECAKEWCDCQLPVPWEGHVIVFGELEVSSESGAKRTARALEGGGLLGAEHRV